MELSKLLGVTFNDPTLLLQAITHTSYANENGTEHNERLEFLGDAVIELCMSDFLYTQKGNADEGEMTKQRAQAVCEEALLKYAMHLDLPRYLRLGKGEEMTGGRERPTVISDAFEAIFGAIYLDQGFEVAKKVFSQTVLPNMNEVKVIKDYKSTLQELVQADKRTLTYKIEKESGPAHNKIFVASVKMDNILMGKGEGKTKKDAEQNAAKEALEKLAHGMVKDDPYGF